MLQQPIDTVFSEPRNVLICGAGGGFDLIAGLSVALALIEQGHTVHLGNLSFMALRGIQGGRWLDDVTLEVNAHCSISEGYAPEIWLAQWLRDEDLERPVHCFLKTGGRPLAESYQNLVRRLGVDALLLVDGGVDAFLRGDEFSLGTPTLDHLSVAAAASTEVETKLIASVGFGAERWDKISHAQALERFSNLMAINAALGAELLVSTSPVVKRWLRALRYIHNLQGPLLRSIVSGSIECAVEGKFGDVSVNARTEQTPIWLSPLTALVWFFRLDPVARAKPYLDELLRTETVAEAADIINAHHDAHRTPSIPIPI